MFDTHCHLNFKRFKNSIPEVIQRAQAAGVTGIIIPGTDLYTSKVSVELSNQYEGVFSAVGIHPHHAIQYQKSNVPTSPKVPLGVSKSQIYKSKLKSNIEELKRLLTHPKVVAVGEVGLDTFQYTNTKYQTYQINAEFIEAQKQLLVEQIKLALEYDKSLILHNREAKEDLLPLLEKHWDKKLEGKTVFHCCEPDIELLEFAQKHGIFIGVDGDVTYDKTKQEFIKEIPIEMLVVETDSPFILPEPLKSEKKYPNEPAYVQYVVEEVAKLMDSSIEEVSQITMENGRRLFNL